MVTLGQQLLPMTSDNAAVEWAMQTEGARALVARKHRFMGQN